jgi:very-short-patch-repair endonuclease
MCRWLVVPFRAMAASARLSESRDASCARIAAAQHGVVSRSQAWESGILKHGVQDRIRSGLWTVVLPGVYRLSGAPVTWEQELMAACLWAREGAAVSHRAAAAMWRLEGFLPGALEISTIRDLKAPAQRLTIHRVLNLDSSDLASLAGIPVTSPARTLLDLCGPRIVNDRAVLEVAMDDALRRRLTSRPRLEWTLNRLGRQGRPGTKIMKQLLQERAPASGVSASELETRLIKTLRAANLPLPHCEYPIKDRGELLARVDLAYPEAGLAIEADGYRFHSGRVAWQRDRRRRNALTSRGWRVLHVTWDDLRARSDEVIEEIRKALETPGTERVVRNARKARG